MSLKNLEQIEHLQNQLKVARSEVNNLRQQVKSLQYGQQKEYEWLLKKLKDFKCEDCQSNSVEGASAEIPAECKIEYIGRIVTQFTEKRATPRQPSVSNNTLAKLVLDNSVFTNPEHALKGLEEFSHMWILFHFHKNTEKHTKAKVSPPRLNGLRVGLFATRSPHRPSPIGMSLVKIEQILGHTIYFSGVDMIDGTPVIDIKPYIPLYDSPIVLGAVSDRSVDGTEIATEQGFPGEVASSHEFSVGTHMGEREAPDGEEGEQQTSVSNPVDTVRVPEWITHPPIPSLTVVFSDRALAQLEELQGSAASERRTEIQNVLREDPRSVYLRERWSNHYYTFRMAQMHVSCKFDDAAHTVIVLQIRAAENVSSE